MTRDRVERARTVTSLEQQPDRDLGRLVQAGEFAAPGAQVPAGQRGPERALTLEGGRRDVQAQLVGAAWFPRVEDGRSRHRVLPVPADQAEREPAATARAAAGSTVPAAGSRCRSRWQPPLPSAMRCTRRYASPSGGSRVANSPAAPRDGDSVVPVTSRQNATPASNKPAGKSWNRVSHRNVTPLRMPYADREDPGGPACSQRGKRHERRESRWLLPSTRRPASCSTPGTSRPWPR